MQYLGWNILWRKQLLSTPVLLPGEFQGQRSLVSYGPQCCKESDTTEQLILSFHQLGTILCTKHMTNRTIFTQFSKYWTVRLKLLNHKKGAHNPELWAPQYMFLHGILSSLKKREEKVFLQARVKQIQRTDPVSKINIKLKALSIWLN